MALGFDNVSPPTSFSGFAASLETAAWLISGSNRALYSFVGLDATVPADPTNVKWGGAAGTSLTQIGTTLNVGSFGKISAYRLTAPSASNLTLYVDWAAGHDEGMLAGLSYTGVDQTTPEGSLATNVGSFSGVNSGIASVTLATSVGDYVLACCLVIDQAFHAPVSAPTGSPAPTERYEVEPSTASMMAVQEVVATGTSTTIQFSITGNGGNFTADWGVAAFVVKADGGPPPIPSKFVVPQSHRPAPFKPGFAR